MRKGRIIDVVCLLVAVLGITLTFLRFVPTEKETFAEIEVKATHLHPAVAEALMTFEDGNLYGGKAEQKGESVKEKSKQSFILEGEWHLVPIEQKVDVNMTLIVEGKIKDGQFFTKNGPIAPGAETELHGKGLAVFVQICKIKTIS